MPLEPSPGARTPAERMRASRERRAARSVELPGHVLTQIEAIRDRDGDASLAAVVTRLVEAAV